ncbi:hypothetical protein BP6252_06741 [Coleophoma cylindrospora]|uniref:DUF1254 domain-containing protein n=1 Tax=Coleophoma cylindrospora TaxID=1849047 RepID=A0A3D8RG37_9HELO|nr:hypothetical protein BP6252_06741 [Coleophoma cylindrospora]
MLLSLALISLAIVGLVSSTPAPRQELSLLTKYGLPSNPFGATAFSFLYGEPLLYYAQEFNGSTGLIKMGTNNYTVSNGGYLSNASFNQVTHPNVDTLYALAVIDLSENDVEIHFPPYQMDRVVIVDFWDPYGTCYNSLSSIRASDPGTYLLRPNLQRGPFPPSPCNSSYQACIDSPTMDGTMAVRVEVKNNGTDEAYARSYINDFTVAPVNLHSSKMAPLKPADCAVYSKNTTVMILQLLARLADRNPPWTSLYANQVPEILKLAGISNGTYTQPTGVNLQEAYSYINGSIYNYSTTNASVTPQNNGWHIINPKSQAAFENGTDLAGRNFWGRGLYLATLPREAVYPMPSSNSFVLQQNESLLVTFSAKPHIGDPGFWSLTAYDAAGYLVSNPLSIYEVGDRSNLTYSDGTPLYPDGLNSSSSHPDGHFQILMQPYNVRPPTNWTNNWLPTPPNATMFTLTFRVYNALDTMKNGSYQYPILTQQAAII